MEIHENVSRIHLPNVGIFDTRFCVTKLPLLKKRCTHYFSSVLCLHIGWQPIQFILQKVSKRVRERQYTKTGILTLAISHAFVCI